MKQNTPWRLTFGLSLAAALSACGSDDSGAEQTSTADPYADSAAPSNYTQAVSLNFEGALGSDPLSCSAESEVGTETSTAVLADARMYISGVELKAQGGDWVTVHLDADGTWQRAQVALLDFENKTGKCEDSGSSDTNLKVTGTVPAGDYEAVRFNIGVPTALNHLDANTSPAPFNAEGLYWTWLTGYKYLRVDWMVQSGSTPGGQPLYERWNIHLGATGCENAEGSRTSAPDTACSHPNMPVVELDEFNPEADVIVFDATKLVEGSDVTSNLEDTPPGCMSGANDTDCEEVFDALGVDFATGQSTGTQTVFSVRQGS